MFRNFFHIRIQNVNSVFGKDMAWRAAKRHEKKWGRRLRNLLAVSTGEGLVHGLDDLRGSRDHFAICNGRCAIAPSVVLPRRGRWPTGHRLSHFWRGAERLTRGGTVLDAESGLVRRKPCAQNANLTIFES